MSLKEEIYNPLEQYREVYKEKFREVAARTFEELAAASKVSTADNKATCDEIRRNSSCLEELKSKQLKWRLICGLMYVLIIAGVIIAWLIFDSDYTFFNLSYEDNQTILAVIGFAIVFIIITLIMKIHPCLNMIASERETLEDKIRELKDEAWQQMEPLNRLYDWDIFARMMSETVPKLEFDPFFTEQRLQDLKRVYGWTDSFNEKRSVIYSHSGLINGNPFVLCRTRKMEMGTKTYYGHKTIHWTTYERDSQGRTQAVHHTETLTASYTAPYPYYNEATRLIYGNIAAPDLCFKRTKNTFNGEQGSLSYKWKLHKLKKRAERKDSNFVMMQNEDFEVLFNTANRNNEQQYRLLFTPLAQRSMLDLLRDETEGYGDDFDFSKDHMINFIVADHIQGVEFDMNPSHYRHYDFEFAKNNFVKLNAEYFRSMYFCLAPLLCVPMYQQIRTHENIYGYHDKPKSAFWEHEALANFWGEDKFKHPRCVTQNILKTEQQELSDGSSNITVTAYGHESRRHIYTESVWGGDGRMHSVPVEWFEYLPVVGSGNILMNEDTQDDSALNPTERHSHIQNRLHVVGGKGIYRRHIASRI